MSALDLASLQTPGPWVRARRDLQALAAHPGMSITLALRLVELALADDQLRQQLLGRLEANVSGTHAAMHRRRVQLLWDRFVPVLHQALQLEPSAATAAVRAPVLAFAAGVAAVAVRFPVPPHDPLDWIALSTQLEEVEARSVVARAALRPFQERIKSHPLRQSETAVQNFAIMTAHAVLDRWNA